MVPSADNLIWALAGLAAGLVLAMAGFALMAFIERRALRRRLWAGRRATAALAEPATIESTERTGPLFAAPVVTESVAVPPTPPPGKVPAPPERQEATVGPAEVAMAAEPAPATTPDVAEAAETPATVPPALLEPEPPAAVPEEPKEQPLPKGIQAAVAEAAKRRRAQRAIERGEPVPTELLALPRPASSAPPSRASGAWMRPAVVPDDAPVRSDVNVEALFEKAFGETTDLSADEKSGRDAGSP
jgi:hypothetical protein